MIKSIYYIQENTAQCIMKPCSPMSKSPGMQMPIRPEQPTKKSRSKRKIRQQHSKQQ